MDVQTVKAAIRAELSQRIAMSGGPEVFRRLAGGGATETLKQALDELEKEGWLKRTELRVGTVYHYPPNVKASLGWMNKVLSEPPPVKPVRAGATHAPAAKPAAPATRPAAPPAPAAAAPAPPAAAPAASSGPVRAQKKSAQTDGGETTAAPVPAAHTGPVRAQKKSAQTDGGDPSAAAPPAAFSGPVRAQKRSAVDAAPVAPAAPAAFSGPVRAQKRSAVDAAPVAPAAFSGPVRAKKRSEIEADATSPALPPDAPLPPASVGEEPARERSEFVAEPVVVAATPAFTGPVRAKKRSELGAAAARDTTPASASGGVEAAPTAAAQEAPRAFTGPVRAKKRSETESTAA